MAAIPIVVCTRRAKAFGLKFLRKSREKFEVLHLLLLVRSFLPTERGLVATIAHNYRLAMACFRSNLLRHCDFELVSVVVFTKCFRTRGVSVGSCRVSPFIWANDECARSLQQRKSLRNFHTDGVVILTTEMKEVANEALKIFVIQSSVLIMVPGKYEPSRWHPNEGTVPTF